MHIPFGRVLAAGATLSAPAARPGTRMMASTSTGQGIEDSDKLGERRVRPCILHSTAIDAVASFNAGALSRRQFCEEAASFTATQAALSSPKLLAGSLKKVELTSAFHGDDSDWMPENIEYAFPHLVELGADVVMLVEENTEWGEYDGEGGKT